MEAVTAGERERARARKGVTCRATRRRLPTRAALFLRTTMTAAAAPRRGERARPRLKTVSSFRSLSLNIHTYGSLLDATAAVGECGARDNTEAIFGGGGEERGTGEGERLYYVWHSHLVSPSVSQSLKSESARLVKTKRSRERASAMLSSYAAAAAATAAAEARVTLGLTQHSPSSLSPLGGHTRPPSARSVRRQRPLLV